MLIRIKNLRLRTIVGVNEWERERPQDVIVNVELEFDSKKAVETDNLKDTVNYKTLKQRIIQKVESAQFFLVEKLASQILEIVMEDPKVQHAQVEVDKPHALRFADSVSVICKADRSK